MKSSKKSGAELIPPKILTVREVSEYLRVHPATILQAVALEADLWLSRRFGLAFRPQRDRSLESRENQAAVSSGMNLSR
jgi:hypothetical protein